MKCKNCNSDNNEQAKFCKDCGTSLNEQMPQSRKKSSNKVIKTFLIFIGLGVWMIVLQNFNVFDNRQDVYVRGGYIDADVSGSVSVGNTVDINIDEVLGYPVGCRTSYDIDGKSYKSLDVSVR